MESPRYLPDHCWEKILSGINIQDDQRPLDWLSLVSKQFLSVTNQILETLKVFDRTKVNLTEYLRRFPHIKFINLSDCIEDITSLLLDIAHSDLDLQGLDLSHQKALPLGYLNEIAMTKRNFRVLKSSRLSVLSDADLIAIGNAFPSLEELDISYPSRGSSVSDEGIIALSTKLSNLAKINLAGNLALSDESLKSLALNCAKLREVALQHCCHMTQFGVAFLVHKNPNLVALSLAFPGGLFANSGIPFATLRMLNTLEFFHMDISDHAFFQIADAKIPLKKFSLCHCREFTSAGVIYFLHTYDSLESIAFADIHFLNDQYVTLFSKFFKKAVSIRLNCCPRLSDQAFNILSEACHRLEKLEMAKTGMACPNPRNNLRVNPKLEYLNLSGNRFWGIQTATSFALHCPNIVYLDLSCGTPSSQRVIVILESCKKLRHLKINWCHNIQGVQGNSRFERLETLEAMATLTDQSLVMFARRSPALRRLNVMHCQITETAIIEVLAHCEQLMDINIMGCNIEPEFIDWMLEFRPRLRHIVPPDCLYSGYNQLPILGCSYCKV